MVLQSHYHLYRPSPIIRVYQDYTCYTKPPKTVTNCLPSSFCSLSFADGSRAYDSGRVAHRGHGAEAEVIHVLSGEQQTPQLTSCSMGGHLKHNFLLELCLTDKDLVDLIAILQIKLFHPI